MAIKVVVVFEDGRAETIREYDDFSEAVSDALKLANTHGEDQGDGSGPPRLIEVHDDDRIELAIRVIRGGLAGQRADDRSPAN